MADLGVQYSVSDFEELGDSTPVPEGEYTVSIESSEIESLASGNGKRLKMTYVISRGKHAKRKLFDNLNLWHESSEEAVKFSWRLLAQIYRAVGIDNMKDTSDLHGKNINVRTEIEEGTNGKKYNKITSYKKASTVDAVVEQDRPTPTPKPPATGKAPMPWEKK